MTTKRVSNKRHLSALLRAPFWVVGAALSCVSVSSPAQEQKSTAASIESRAASIPSAGLEKAFWICDHAATKHGVDGGTAIICGAITEDLKMKKFSGDFNLMLAWWRQNKAAEHQALTTAGYAVSGR